MGSKIVQKEDKVLRQIAEPIKVANIKTEKIQKIIADMIATLAKETDGVALAAPQIGLSLQIFIVSGKALVIDTDGNIPEDYTSGQKPYPADLVFINPQITKLSKKKKIMDEGCLSVRWLYGKTKRSDKATVEAYDENGKKFTYNGSGLMAQIFQHETDHLNGVLFIDHAKNLVEAKPEK